MKTSFLTVALAALFVSPAFAVPPQTAGGVEVDSQAPGQASDAVTYVPSPDEYVVGADVYAQAPGYYVVPGYVVSSPPVIRDYRFVGRDPDPNIRENLSRDANRNEY